MPITLRWSGWPAGLLGTDDPEDIAAEAFARLIRKGVLVADPAPYLRAIVCNLTRNRHLRVVREKTPRAVSEPSPEQAAIVHEDHAEVIAALAALPGRRREAIVLRFLARSIRTRDRHDHGRIAGNRQIAAEPRPGRARPGAGGKGMNNHPIQDRLRDALAAHAQKFSASPDAWEHVQAKHASLSRHRGGRSGPPRAGWLARHRACVIPAAAVAAVALSTTALVQGFSGTRPTSLVLTADEAVNAVKGVPCVGTDQEQKGVPLPDGFVAQAANRCIYTRRVIPGQGLWQFQLTQVAYNGLAQLTAALRRPSVTAPANTACPAPGIAVEPFVLRGSNGQDIAPRLPTTICGEPQQQALTALLAIINRASWG